MAQLTGTINQLSSILAPKIFFSTKKWSKIFSSNTWQMMIFLNPLDALIPKIPFSFFADFWSGSPPRPGGQSR